MAQTQTVHRIDSQSQQTALAGSHRSSWRRVYLFLRRPLHAFAFIILIVTLICALWPVDRLPHDPTNSELSLRLVPPMWISGADLAYPLGTDNLGRDILSRIIHGSRYSLLIASSAVFISGVIGLFSGLTAGFFRGNIDDFIMRLVDVQLAFPTIILIIAVVGVFGPSLRNLILILGISGWAVFARFVRGTTLSIREKEYIESARAIGAENFHIMLHHIVPNLASDVIVLASFELARVLLLEAGLSFLGLGVQPPTPSWGGMIGDGRNYLYEGWWISAFPGVAIMLTVLSFNFLGDGLRDILDPHTRFE